MRLESFARHPLMFGPSPVHPLDRLTAHLGAARLWAKRDDCNSGLAYGGNKTRKLEYLVADALAKGCDTLVSIGGVQSNHTRQVAAAAARTGLGCVLVQESWVDWPDVAYDRVGNIQLSRIMGADVRLVRSEFGIGFKESWEQALADVERAGGTPYAIPAGASDHELGRLGFARWARELAEQERELGIRLNAQGERRRRTAISPRPTSARPAAGIQSGVPSSRAGSASEITSGGSGVSRPLPAGSLAASYVPPAPMRSARLPFGKATKSLVGRASGPPTLSAG